MPDAPQPVREEGQLLQTVQANLRRLREKTDRPDHDRDLLELRDALAEEKLPDDIASILEAMDRSAALKDQQARSTEGHADPASPYFGHLVLRDQFGTRTVLIGKATLLSDRVRIVDWRHAPVSRIYYQYAEGDEYEEEIAGRKLEGEVLVKRGVTITVGELVRVTTHEETWVRTTEDAWVDVRAHEARLAGGAGAAIRAASLGRGLTYRADKHLPEITSLLDPAQFRLISRPDTGLVVIQGSAGSGKTTVGLHRIAYLTYLDPRQFRPAHMLVVVFSRALGRYISQVLPALGVEGVRVVEYETWAQSLRERTFPGLPEAYADDTPALVTRFKTHTAMLHMIEGLREPYAGARVAEVFEDVLTDRSWIEAGLARHAPGEFSDEEIRRIHRWCTDHHFIRTEGGGPRDHDVPCLDREDDSILLRLHQVLKGPLESRAGQILGYDHLMIDEAQDLSPLELAVLLGTTGTRRSVTMAGDVAQKIHESRDFRDWTHALESLRLAHVDVSPLQVSYRSTKPIMEAAHRILGPLASETATPGVREGAPVAHLGFGGMGEAVAWLGPALADLARREHYANVAILAVDLSQAIAWYEALERAEVPYLSLVDDQDFSFAPGIEVSDIRSSKGLEFDYVILVGVDRSGFPDTPAARRLLHVGATRAAHQLWLVSTGNPSPCIPDGLVGLS
jgi:DNA helicase-2/ATP-dependent DNA helicase PcrA